MFGMQLVMEVVKMEFIEDVKEFSEDVEQDTISRNFVNEGDDIIRENGGDESSESIEICLVYGICIPTILASPTRTVSLVALHSLVSSPTCITLIIRHIPHPTRSILGSHHRKYLLQSHHLYNHTLSIRRSTVHMHEKACISRWHYQCHFPLMNLDQ